MSYWLDVEDWDPTKWIWLPYDPEEDDRETLREFAEHYAKAWCADWQGLISPDPDPGELTDVLVGSVIRYSQSFPELQLFLHMTNPFDTPLPVYAGCDDAEGERDEELRGLTQADEEGAVERPVVEPFSTENFGTGLRVLRYELDERDSSLIACLRYAWRVEEAATDVVFISACPEPRRIIQAMDDIDELTRGTSLKRLDEDQD